jgi:hypothetical protein
MNRKIPMFNSVDFGRYTFTALLILFTSSAMAQKKGRSTQGAFGTGPFPAVVAVTEEGKEVSLPDLFKGKITLLTTGCLTCPIFRESYAETEALAHDYASDRVQFFYLYKALAHPEFKGYVGPQNTEERLLHIVQAKKELGTKVPWLCDPISNDVVTALKAGPNSVYLINAKGSVIYSSQWSDAAVLRKKLAELTGEEKTPTPVSALNLPNPNRGSRPPSEATDTRVVRPVGLVKLLLKPSKPDDIYYVKLRAEAEPELMETGKGRLYLGFFPDPMRGAHWNNLVDPLHYKLTLPEGVSAEPLEAVAAKSSGESDADPREFWVTFDGDTLPESIVLTMNYFACTETLCLPLSQEYTILFEKDNAGGWAYGFSPNKNRNSEQGKKNTDEKKSPSQRSRMERMDADKDGAVSLSEMSAMMKKRGGQDIDETQIRRRFDELDKDEDGKLSAEELENMQGKRGR